MSERGTTFRRRTAARRSVIIAAVTFRELGRTAGHGFLSRLMRRNRTADAHHPGPPRLFTELGPTFIKIGQLLATRKDLVPESWIPSLSQLADNVPPPLGADIRAVLESAFSGREWPFTRFDIEPVASGSIATVHRAVLTNGDVVAVKIRRPGIDRLMRLDVQIAGTLARTAGHLPGMRRLPMGEMVGQVGAAVVSQTDFAAEQASLTALRLNLAGLPHVVIPRPYAEFCTSQVIVMEFIGDLRRFSPAELDAEHRRLVVRRTLEMVYQMLFTDGLVHCDLHPGNLYLTAEAGIIVLDAGFVVRLPARERTLFADFFFNMAIGRGKRCADLVIESASAVPEDCDLTQFREKLSQLVHDTSTLLAGDFNLGQFAPKLFALQRSFGLFAAPEFAFPLLSLLVIEGMIKDFDADVDFQSVALPVLVRALSNAG